MGTAATEPQPESGLGDALPRTQLPDPDEAISIRVVYACPHCARPLRLRPEYFGSSLVCKHCDRSFVPSLAQALSDLPARPASPQGLGRSTPGPLMPTLAT